MISGTGEFEFGFLASSALHVFGLDWHGGDLALASWVLAVSFLTSALPVAYISMVLTS